MDNDYWSLSASKEHWQPNGKACNRLPDLELNAKHSRQDPFRIVEKWSMRRSFVYPLAWVT